MHQGLATRYGNHRRAALVHGLEAFFGRQFLFQNVRWILDLAATRAGQIAAEERFEHQDKGIALTALDFLIQDVRGYRPHLRNRYWHRCAYTLASVIKSLSATTGV